MADIIGAGAGISNPFNVSTGGGTGARIVGLSDPKKYPINPLLPVTNKVKQVATNVINDASKTVNDANKGLGIVFSNTIGKPIANTVKTVSTGMIIAGVVVLLFLIEKK